MLVFTMLAYEKKYVSPGGLKSTLCPLQANYFNHFNQFYFQLSLPLAISTFIQSYLNYLASHYF